MASSLERPGINPHNYSDFSGQEPSSVPRGSGFSGHFTGRVKRIAKARKHEETVGTPLSLRVFVLSRFPFCSVRRLVAEFRPPLGKLRLEPRHDARMHRSEPP